MNLGSLRACWPGRRCGATSRWPRWRSTSARRSTPARSAPSTTRTRTSPTRPSPCRACSSWSAALADAGAAGAARRRSPPGAPREAIRFEGVRFRYPGQTADVLAGLDLEIPAGRSLAIVGANGAGKTTLIKLLCRLYEPTAGPDHRRRRRPARARPGGLAAARRGDLPGLRRSTTCRRATTSRFGAPERRRRPRRGCARAAEQAGALDLIEALPRGWDTVLSRQYTGGVDLSGGQWQRIALARALFAVEGGARRADPRRADRQPRRARRGGALRPLPRPHRRPDHDPDLAPLLDRAPGRPHRRARRRPGRRGRQPRRAGRAGGRYATHVRACRRRASPTTADGRRPRRSRERDRGRRAPAERRAAVAARPSAS